jgi:quaternary ammonium compound-resistance protein SugE
MAWFWLLLAGLLEIVWAFSMKRSEGLTRWAPASVTLIAMIASFGLLALSLKTLPLGTAYGVWTGIGAVGAFVVGVALLDEPLTFARSAAVALIVAGIALLKLTN